MAGPNGIKINDLHLTERGHTTETFSAIGVIDSDSDVWNLLSAKELTDWQKFKKNFSSTVLWFLLGLAVLSAAFWISHQFVAYPDRLGSSAKRMLEAASHTMGAVELSVMLAIVIAVLAIALLEGGKLLKPLHKLLSYADSNGLSEDVRYSSVIKPKTDGIHLGHLPVTFDITDKALVVRSHGDKFVAVIAKDSIKARLGTDASGAPLSEMLPWCGQTLTPPVLIEIYDADYRSTLIVHGAHFETPGAKAKKNRERAKAFKEQITP